MSAIKSCYNCPDREVGCHAHCERYLQEKNKHDKAREKAQIEKDNDLYFRGVAAKNFHMGLKKRKLHNTYARRPKG